MALLARGAFVAEDDEAEVDGSEGDEEKEVGEVGNDFYVSDKGEEYSE